MRENVQSKRSEKCQKFRKQQNCHNFNVSKNKTGLERQHESKNKSLLTESTIPIQLLNRP